MFRSSIKKEKKSDREITTFKAILARKLSWKGAKIVKILWYFCSLNARLMLNGNLF